MNQNEIDETEKFILSKDSSIINLRPKKSKWTLVGSAIIISIACIDPGNLQGFKFFKINF